MQTNIERVAEMIRALPVEDLDKLSEVIAEEKRVKGTKDADLQKQLDDYAKAKKWIAENGEKYVNKWVCLEGDKLIAVDDDGRTVYQKAKAAGIESPFIHYIEKEPEAFWGGWL
jgi:hypothetical protein